MLLVGYTTFTTNVSTEKLHPLDSFCRVFGEESSQKTFCLFRNVLLTWELEFCFFEDLD